ncbi:hypothetical protein ACHMWN_12140 [Pedobacter sp. UC225_61]|uniref:hypothetical protein n=1 Tax=Pedobacter sp. UC225_61 TaxID=3374623 RepID=UPI0037A9FFA7
MNSNQLKEKPRSGIYWLLAITLLGLIASIIYIIVLKYPSKTFSGELEQHSAFNVNQYLANTTIKLENRVRVAVLNVSGIKEPNPTTIDNTQKLSVYKFKDGHIHILTGRLNIALLADKPNAPTLYANDVKAASTVQDLIDLIEENLK